MSIRSNNRRAFLKAGLASAAGLVVAPALKGDSTKSDKLEVSLKYPLLKRKLGKTGLEVPVVSMGVMNADNPNLVIAALDSGILMLDTAHVYQRGRNEEMIGKAVSKRARDSFLLATKVRGEPQDRRTGLFTEETRPGPFLEKFDKSLKRLKMDYVDILYLHNIVKREAALFEPLLSAMSRLKKEGKVRFLGVSTHSNEPEVIRAAVESKVYDIVLTAYNFRQPHREEIRKAIAEAAKAGLGIVAMKTQAGVYADKERTTIFNMKAALKWALQDPNVHTSIPGFTTFDQMELDLSVMADLKLTPGEKSDLKQHELLASDALFCAQCRQCVPQCPAGMDIPALMRGYTYAHGYRNLIAAKEALEEARPGGLPCFSCQVCRVTCAHGIDIQERALDLARLDNIPDDFLTV